MLLRHHHRIARLRHRGVEQHGGAAELHGERGIGGGADAGVEHHRHRRARADQLDQMRIADAEPGADRRAERHHRRRAGIGELAADHRVFGAVGQHDEALRHQRLGGAHELLGVGIEQLAVADHFELDPVGLERLARELGGEHGVLRGLAAGGIGQEMDAARRADRPGFRRRRRG